MNWLFCLKWDPSELQERHEKGVFRAAHPHIPFLSQCLPPGSYLISVPLAPAIHPIQQCWQHTYIINLHSVRETVVSILPEWINFSETFRLSCLFCSWPLLWLYQYAPRYLKCSTTLMSPSSPRGTFGIGKLCSAAVQVAKFHISILVNHHQTHFAILLTYGLGYFCRTHPIFLEKSNVIYIHGIV